MIRSAYIYVCKGERGNGYSRYCVNCLCDCCGNVAKLDGADICNRCFIKNQHQEALDALHQEQITQNLVRSHERILARLERRLAGGVDGVRNRMDNVATRRAQLAPSVVQWLSSSPLSLATVASRRIVRAPPRVRAPPVAPVAPDGGYNGNDTFDQMERAREEMQVTDDVGELPISNINMNT